MTEAPSTTSYTVDTVSGNQIQTTNNAEVIKKSEPVQHVVTSLVNTQTIPRDSEVVSTVTKTSEDTIQTTSVIKSSTVNKVVVTSTNKKTQ